MTSIEKTIQAFFDMRNPSEVLFQLPDRVPELPWATTAIDTLRNLHDIDRLICRPNSFELEALMARGYDTVDLLAEVILTVMELMDVDSVHKIAISVKLSLTSMTAEDHLVAALRHLAVREWTSIHSLSLGMAREGWTELDQRLKALQATENIQAVDWAEAEKVLDGSRATLTSTRQSYNDSRGGANLNDDGLIELGYLVKSLATDVSDLEKALETDFARLDATRREISVLASILEEAQAKVDEIEKLTCPDYKVAVSKGGNVALFTLKTRLGGDNAPEGNLDVEPDVADETTDKMSTDKA